ncbi:MAG: hypothetical protein HOO86_16005 [Bacteroidales bacterium]|nr:hypothetical protein [Bacteroidales bacterium]
MPICLVLIVTVLARFWNLGSIPFMHDEFSALFRTEYNSFNDLIEFGVLKNDTHPAGVQVFLYYWVKWVGFDEFWIKFPFALVGVISVWFLYAIGKQWFNETTALIGASFMAINQYFVFYSQLARPYSMGLFAIVLLVFVWTKIVNSEKPTLLLWVFFAFALFFASIIHAFSMFAALIIYFSGFWLLKATNRIYYLYAAIVATVLYSPHIPVFYFQLTQSDLGGWLGEPTPNFIFEFLWYFLHFSLPFVGVTLGVVLLSLFTMEKPPWKNWQFKLIGILWFAISYVTAYLYSIYRTPIIQFSTLYFTFPFFFLTVFSFFKPLKMRYNLLLVIIILTIGSSTLIFQRQHFNLISHQGYDQAAKTAAKDSQNSGNTTLAFFSSTPQMVGFYLKKEQIAEYTLFSKHIPTGIFKSFVDKQVKRSFILAITDGGPTDWIEIVRNKYPYLIRSETWFNTEYFLFTQDISTNERQVKRWNSVYYIIDNLKHVPLNGRADFDETRIYGEAWVAICDTLFDPRYPQLISVNASGVATDTLIKTKLVVELNHPETKELLHWQAGTLYNDTILPGESFFLTSVLNTDQVDFYPEKIMFRTYIWNPEGSQFTIRTMYIGIRRQSPKFYGLFRPV